MEGVGVFRGDDGAVLSFNNYFGGSVDVGYDLGKAHGTGFNYDVGEAEFFN